ncbi:target of Nesh-SH3 isoform X7 [Protopterus annectens]|uniref:target of Nesh-SH3 isoform X7 n=1 Tax=Protopterus annectens TaxID=7888 RepID=UPI001CFC1F84|nr:target of Nesh-SH3 isoform X7 [Protopterus annectens]
MNPRLVFLLFCGVIIPELGNTQLFLRARRTSDLTIPYCPPGYYWTPDGLIEARAPLLKREPLRVLINATGDTIVMKFLRPSPSTKLEGYILGYGSSFYSKQYIPFPENGKPFVTEIEAEPKYLISVQPVQPVHPLLTLRKYCAASQITRQKPLHLVVGTLTPTSVLLSWGILIKSQKSGILMNDCLEDRMYTVRYKENEKKNWLFQSCPTTETVIDKLKPDTIYEFGVKDKDDRTWSNRVIHKLETYSEKGNTKIRKPSLPEKQIPVYVDRKENKVIFKKSQPGWNETHKLPSYPKTTQPPTVTETKSVPTRVLKGSFKPSASATTFHEKPQPTLGNGVYAEHQQEIFTSIKSDLPGLSNTNQASTEPQPETSATELHDIPDLPENLLASSEPEMEHPESRSHDRSTLSANPQATPEVKLESPLDKIYTTRNLPEAPQVTVEPEKEASVSTPYDRSELPENQEATNEPESETVLYKSYIIPALPKTHEATNEPESETILSKSYIIPGLSKTHEATDEPDLKTPVHKSHDTSALPTSQHAAKELELEIPVHKTPETSLSPELMHVSYSADMEMPIQKTYNTLVITEKKTLIPKTNNILVITGTMQATNEPNLETPVPQNHVTSDLSDIQEAPTGTHHSDIPNNSKQNYTHLLPEEIPALTETPQRNDMSSTSAKGDLTSSLPGPSAIPHTDIPNKPKPTNSLPKGAGIQALTETPQQQSDNIVMSAKDDVTSASSLSGPSAIPHTDIPNKPKPTNSLPKGAGIQALTETPQQQSDNIVMSAKDDVTSASSLSAPSTTAHTEMPSKPKPTPPLALPEATMVHKETQQESEKSASSDKDGVAQGLPALKEATQEPAKLLTPFSEHQRAIIAPNGTPQSDIPNESKTTYTFVLPEEILALTETPQQNDNHTTSAKDDVANSLPDPHGTPPSEITIKPLPPYALVMPEEIQAPTETKQESDKSTVSTEEDMISTLPALNESFQEPVRPQTSLPEKPSPVIAANETLPEYYKSVASSLPEGSGTTKAYFETSSPKANDTQEMLQTNLVQSNKDQGSSKPRKPVSDPGVTALGYDQQLQAPQKPKSPDTSVIPITSLASSEKLEERPIIAATEKHQDVAAAPKKIRQKTENNKPSRRPELVKSVTGSVISANQASIHPSTARNRATRPPFPRHPFISRGTPKQTQPPKPNANTRKPLPPNQIPGKPGIKETTLRPIQSSSTVRSPSKPVVNPTKGKVKEQGTETTAPSADITSTDPPAIFSSTPTSLTDMMGESRYIAPHVVFMPKNETDPCSITDTVKYFPDTEASHQNISTPPQQPPSNLTVITVEGCPSFVILNWTEANNDTATEYIVKSMVNGTAPGKGISIQVTNQTHSAVENLMPNTSYVFQVTPSNILGQGPPSNQVEFNTESADPRVSEYISVGKDAIWTEIRFKSDTYSECHGKQFVKRTWYKKFVGVQLCNSLRYKIYLGDSLGGTFYNIGDQSGFGEDHCQFVDSFLDGKTGRQLHPDQLPNKQGYYRSVRQEPVHFGEIGGNTHASYVHWYECGTTIPGKW